MIPCLSILSQQKIFSLEEAIKTALSNNREILISKMEIEKAEAAVAEAFGYALPTLDVSGNFTHMIEKPKMAFPDFEALLTNATYEILFQENVIPRDESKFLSANTPNINVKRFFFFSFKKCTKAVIL